MEKGGKYIVLDSRGRTMTQNAAILDNCLLKVPHGNRHAGGYQKTGKAKVYTEVVMVSNKEGKRGVPATTSPPSAS